MRLCSDKFFTSHEMDCLSCLVQEKTGKSRPTELISGEGVFNAAGFKDLLNSVRLDEAGRSNYAVVAIMGPQGGGKSTLVNLLFSTNFRERNASNGMTRTTKGIWIAKASDMEPLTIVLDMEGTDGQERGQDDTAFEKQSALFALAVADTVLVNMWCHDIGREHAANRPLLKTIFEAMMRLFSPHKTTLLFVIRDKTIMTPFKILERDLRDDIQKIWKAVPKPKGNEDTTLTKFFNVEVTALSHYEWARNDFENEVSQLRLQYFDSINPRRLVGERDQELPFRSAKKVWDIIKEYKDLDLPPHKVMVATVRCETIAMDKLRLFKSDKDWLALQEKAKTRLFWGFGARISSILSNYLIEYDSESKSFVELDVRNAKRQYLESEALKVVHPAYTDILGHLRSEASRSFETQLKAHMSEGRGFAESVRRCRQSCLIQFDLQCSDHAAIKQAKWEDASTVKRELLRDIENHALLVRTETLPQIEAQQWERLCTKLTKKLNYLVSDASQKDIWGCIRSFLRSESDAAALALSSALVMFELDTREVEQMVDNLRQHARKFVVTRFKEETEDVVLLMKRRFIWALSQMESATTDETAKKIDPYDHCLKFLSMAAVIRLDERDDNVESVLFSALMGADGGVASTLPISWEEVPPEMTLISPDACREIWNKFKQDMMRDLKNAETVKRAKEHGSVSTWVILGVMVLGVAACIVLIRVSNIDLGLALLAAGVAGAAALVDGICTFMEMDTKAFRKKLRKIMKRLQACLKVLNDFITAILKGRPAFEVNICHTA